MGTDIHIYAEVLTDEGWRPTPPFSEKPWSRGRKTPTPALDIGRPRNLISVLSGTKAGIQARMVEDEMPTFSPPRGLPADMNPSYREHFSSSYDEEGGYWGATWLWLRELLEFDWHGTRVSLQGFVEPELAPLFHRDQPFPAGFPEDGKLFHGLLCGPPADTVAVSWSVSLAEFVGCLDSFLDGLGKLGPPDKVRVIFWFDS